MQIRATDLSVIDKLKRFLREGKFDYITEDVLTEGYQKRILYPTEDFHLTEVQFDAIKRLLCPNEHLNLFQMGFKDGFFSPQNSYHHMNCDLSYQDYDEIWIDSIAILSPDSYEWIVLIDEAAEGGLGVFIAPEEIIREFSQIYTNFVSDIINFVDYFVRKRRSTPEMYKYMMDVLHMCE